MEIVFNVLETTLESDNPLYIAPEDMEKTLRSMAQHNPFTIEYLENIIKKAFNEHDYIVTVEHHFNYITYIVVFQDPLEAFHWHMSDDHSKVSHYIYLQCITHLSTAHL